MHSHPVDTEVLVIDQALLSRYDKTGPRYTSYPTAVQFTDDFSDSDYIQATALSNVAPSKPLSLYFHIPFCATLCFYCACNKVVTKNRDRATEYLKYLYTEIAMQGELYDDERVVQQLHLGGGTPTFLSIEQIEQLLAVSKESFNLVIDKQRDYSIELDPRTVSVDAIKDLRELGFNRLSLGVQDFDPHVQKAVHRIQSEQDTLRIIEVAKEQKYESINVDLIYGLPLQNASSFAQTLDTIVRAAPDRLSIFNYAHLPQLFMPQRRIKEAELPTAEQKLDMLSCTVEQLTSAGYVYIGMDHFAKPDDSLVKARNQHKLHRNFQGYTSHADCDLIGMGVTAISSVANCYSQNIKTLDEYYAVVAQQKLPVSRGININREDFLRREIIESLMCYGEIDFAEFEKRYEIDFNYYFSKELGDLEKMHFDGLIERNAQRVTVLPPGRFLMRNIGMVFDAYLQSSQETPRFSRIV